MLDLAKELLLLTNSPIAAAAQVQQGPYRHARTAGAFSHRKVIQSSICSKLIACFLHCWGDCIQVTVITATGEWKLHSLLLASRSEFFYRCLCSHRVTSHLASSIHQKMPTMFPLILSCLLLCAHCSHSRSAHTAFIG